MNNRPSDSPAPVIPHAAALRARARRGAGGASGRRFGTHPHDAAESPFGGPFTNELRPSRRGSSYDDVPPARAKPPEPARDRRTMSEDHANLTQLLRAAASGERRDLDALMAAIYEDMHRLARSHMSRERGDHTLQPTALVNEAYLKLIDQRNTDWKDRVHFFAVASRIIRRILVDHAREKLALKRGGGAGERVSMESVAEAVSPVAGVDVIALDEALAELAEIDERQAKVVELRFFGGLTVPEIAELLGIAPRSVDRDWQAAKAWLYCRLSDDAPGGNHG